MNSGENDRENTRSNPAAARVRSPLRPDRLWAQQGVPAKDRHGGRHQPGRLPQPTIWTIPSCQYPPSGNLPPPVPRQRECSLSIQPSRGRTTRQWSPACARPTTGCCITARFSYILSVVGQDRLDDRKGENGPLSDAVRYCPQIGAHHRAGRLGCHQRRSHHHLGLSRKSNAIGSADKGDDCQRRAPGRRYRQRRPPDDRLARPKRSGQRQART